MATPSIVLVPDRYKSGVLYSQLPESGAVDFDVTRATTAYRTNASGVLESVASGVPRLDYTGGGCPALLVEPAATNLLLYSEQLDNAAWGTTNAAITANQAVSPDGFINADKLIDNSTNGLHRTLPTVGSVAANTTYVLSCFAKKAELDYVVLSAGGSSLTGSGGSGADLIASVNLSNGAIVTNNYNVSSVDYGNGWYRISIRLTTDVDGGSFFPYIATSQDGTTVSYVGSGQGIFLWGAQLEVGSVATSYIPTTSASVTRNADVITKTGVSGFIGQTEGTIYVEVNLRNPVGSKRICGVSDGTSSNRIGLGFVGSEFRLTKNTDGSVITQAVTTGVVKIAVAYNTDGFAISINGGAVQTSATSGAGTYNRIDLGQAESNAFQLNDRIRAAAIYTSRLSNAELAALTTL